MFARFMVFSDKYVQGNEFSYTMTVEVGGRDFTEEPVIYSTARAMYHRATSRITTP